MFSIVFALVIPALAVAQTVSENATTITIDAGILSDNINRSLFATAQDELRPVMMVLLRFAG